MRGKCLRGVRQPRSAVERVRDPRAWTLRAAAQCSRGRSQIEYPVSAGELRWTVHGAAAIARGFDSRALLAGPSGLGKRGADVAVAARLIA
jgi:hypothetical protein